VHPLDVGVSDRGDEADERLGLLESPLQARELPSTKIATVVERYCIDGKPLADRDDVMCRSEHGMTFDDRMPVVVLRQADADHLDGVDTDPFAECASYFLTPPHEEEGLAQPEL
jgi:hypothetical protein